MKLNADIEWADPWRHQEREAWRRGESLIGTGSRHDIARALEPWANALLSGGDAEGEIARVSLPAKTPIELSTSLHDVLTGSSSVDDWGCAAWSVIADALAAAFLAATPSRDAVERMFEFSEAPPSFFRAVDANIRNRMGGNWHSWIEFLKSTPPDLTSLLQERGGVALQEVADAWAKRDDPFSVFDAEYRRSGPSFGSAADWERARLGLLLGLSPDDWLVSVDSLPFPNLMWEAIEHLQVRRDGDLIDRLSRSAPPLLTTEGAWSGSVAALLVSELVLDHLSTVHDAVRIASLDLASQVQDEHRRDRAKERLAALEGGELCIWAAGVYHSILQRSDGEAIAFELLARLSRTEIVGEWNHKPGVWSANETALAAMSQAIDHHAIDVRRLRDWWQRQESREVARTGVRGDAIDTSSAAPSLFTEGLPYLIGGVIVLHQRHANPRDAPRAQTGLLWEWASQLFVGRDPGLDLLLAARGDAALRWLGFLLAAQARPDEAWSALHLLLEPQRRRHSQRAREVKAREIHGSYDLGWVGLLGLVMWNDAAPVSERDDIRRFHARLIETARQLYLTLPTAGLLASVQGLLANCFAPARAILGDELGEELIRLLEPIANDPVLVRESFRVLATNGVGDDLLGDVASRLDIDLAASNSIAGRLSANRTR